jgi:prophage tail gpP-like protein
MDQRYSEYRVMIQSMERSDDQGPGGDILATAKDPNVPRTRIMALVSESGFGGQQVGIARGQWEAATRAGRGKQLKVTTDTWRDSAGALYEPNTLIEVDIPALKITAQTWIIGEVTYRKDETGTHCDLTIMPPDAFEVEPILLQATLEGPQGGAQQTAPAR